MSEENLDEDDQKRIDRVRGKRGRRQSRRSSSNREDQQAKQVQQEEQAQQGEQAQQEKKAEQVKDSEPVDATTTNKQMSNTQQANKSTREQQGKQAPQAQQAKLGPVTNREHDTFYLSQDVRDELNQIYRRVSLNILEETGVDIDDQAIGGRNRYFRPLALLLGARKLQEMSPAELRETLEKEDLVDDLPAEDS